MSVSTQYQTTRQLSESLCAPLSVEDYNPQLVDYASPPKWHLAHTSWFFEEMILKRFSDGYQAFDPEFGFLFNSYYNHVGERLARASRGDISVPRVERIFDYRRHVDTHMQALLGNGAPPDALGLAELGVNHEQQHQELLLTDLKYTLGHNPLFPPYGDDVCLVNDTNTGHGSLDMDAGLYEIGHTGEGFCFDNERGRHKVYLNAFTIDHALVTNGEYLEFINAGGYDDFQYWLDDGWHYIRQHGIDSPLYWHQRDGQWHHYTFAGLQPVNPDAMLCHVSFYEANAFAAWRGRRLPTEFEWEAACDQLDWGKRWEWTNSAYLPYPDFAVSAGAVGEYNGKFMVNQMVLRGASVATPTGHSRKTYRNFFHPHLQWQFSGIRLAGGNTTGTG